MAEGSQKYIQGVSLDHHLAEKASNEEQHEDNNGGYRLLAPPVESDQYDGRYDVQLHVYAKVPSVTQTLHYE